MSTNTLEAGLSGKLTPPERLAIAYAPAAARKAWLGLLALEQRLADSAREGREPLMVQLRLAWWRDRFAQPAAQWPQGEPLLALLVEWDQERAGLGGLVDGWEVLRVGEDGGQALDAARAGAFVALGRLLGAGEDPAIAAMAADLIDPQSAGPARALPRAMRPLAILRELAVARARRGGAQHPLADFCRTVRIGMLGR